jgi:hypothetical protein
MTPDVERVSAKIYQFPLKRMRMQPAPAMRMQPAPAMRMQPAPAETRADASLPVLDDCWYHEEAVRQEVKPPCRD